MRGRLLALGQLLVVAATALKAPGLRCYAGAADLVEGASVLLDTANPRVNNVGLGLRVFNAGGEFYGEIAEPEPGDGASIRCVVGLRPSALIQWPRYTSSVAPRTSFLMSHLKPASISLRSTALVASKMPSSVSAATSTSSA